jgi:hypothetical protein
MKLSEEEKTLGKNRIGSLLKAYRQNGINAEQINKYFGEWKEIAQRLKVGGGILDKNQAIQSGSKEHLEGMQDLYAYLLKLLGMYDAFFKVKFSGEIERYERARSAILVELK